MSLREKKIDKANELNSTPTNLILHMLEKQGVTECQ